MSGIFPGDVIIKTMLELGMEDLRREAWILQDIFAAFVKSPLLNKKYGQKEINRAKEFFLNNEIPIYLKHRIDPAHVPCITIHVGSSREDDQEARLGDSTPFTQDLEPNDIGKPIPFIIKPFDISQYDPETGLVCVPDNIDIAPVSSSMILVDIATGNGYVIKDKLPAGLVIDEGLTVNLSKMAVIPAKPVWNAEKEMASFREQYVIGCHGHGEVAQLLFIHSIVMYLILRYRQHLLEKECFQISSISSSEIMENTSEQCDHIYTRNITLTGLVENTWLKLPKRYLESMALGDFDGEGQLIAGLHILSNLYTSDYEEGDPDHVNGVWDTVEEGDPPIPKDGIWRLNRK